jgi:hypothetical protein
LKLGSRQHKLKVWGLNFWISLINQIKSFIEN